MTTRAPSAADIAGTTARGKAAYNQRLRDLRARGIIIPDLHGDAAGGSIYDLDPEAEAAADMAAVDTELKDIERADARATAEQRRDDPWLDRWLREDERKRH